MASRANLPALALEQPREKLWRCRELLDIANTYSDDADLWVFRRFTTLHLFNILHLQRRLSQLEEQLLQLKNNTWLASNSWIPEQEISLYKLTTEIRETLKAYGKPIPLPSLIYTKTLTHLWP
jgi:hypothetical protein